MIFPRVLPIPKSGHEAKYVVAMDARKDGIVWVLLQEDASRSLRSCIYLARILNDCEAIIMLTIANHLSRVRLCLGYG